MEDFSRHKGYIHREFSVQDDGEAFFADAMTNSDKATKHETILSNSLPK